MHFEVKEHRSEQTSRGVGNGKGVVLKPYLYVKALKRCERSRVPVAFIFMTDRPN